MGQDLHCAMQGNLIVLVINDLLFILFLEMYTILLLDSSKSENIPQDPSVLYSGKINSRNFYIYNY